MPHCSFFYVLVTCAIFGILVMKLRSKSSPGAFCFHINENCDVELFCLFVGCTYYLSLVAFGYLIFLCGFSRYSLGLFVVWSL
jgi:hypothetical protein